MKWGLMWQLGSISAFATLHGFVEWFHCTATSWWQVYCLEDFNCTGVCCRPLYLPDLSVKYKSAKQPFFVSSLARMIGKQWNQGCALAKPCGPWCITFCPGPCLENLSNHRSDMLGTPRFHRFTALALYQFFLEHSLENPWLPGIFPTFEESDQHQFSRNNINT